MRLAVNLGGVNATEIAKVKYQINKKCIRQEDENNK